MRSRSFFSTFSSSSDASHPLASIMLMLFRSERGCRQAVPGIEHLRGQTIIAQEKGCHGMSLAVFIPIAMNCVNDEF
jgi:hypothetical protein